MAARQAKSFAPKVIRRRNGVVELRVSLDHLNSWHRNLVDVVIKHSGDPLSADEAGARQMLALNQLYASPGRAPASLIDNQHRDVYTNALNEFGLELASFKSMLIPTRLSVPVLKKALVRGGKGFVVLTTQEVPKESVTKRRFRPDLIPMQA